MSRSSIGSDTSSLEERSCRHIQLDLCYLSHDDNRKFVVASAEEGEPPVDEIGWGQFLLDVCDGRVVDVKAL